MWCVKGLKGIITTVNITNTGKTLTCNLLLSKFAMFTLTHKHAYANTHTVTWLLIYCSLICQCFSFTLENCNMTICPGLSILHEGRGNREGFAHQTGSFEPCSEFTSNRWELTFFPFFIQVMRGFGSPTAWHTNDATPPEIPVWSSGDLMKLGMPEGERQRNKGEEAQTGKQKEEKITSIRWRALTEKQLEANYRDFTALHPLLAITILLF